MAGGQAGRRGRRAITLTLTLTLGVSLSHVPCPTAPQRRYLPGALASCSWRPCVVAIVADSQPSARSQGTGAPLLCTCQCVYNKEPEPGKRCRSRPSSAVVPTPGSRLQSPPHPLKPSTPRPLDPSPRPGLERTPLALSTVSSSSLLSTASLARLRHTRPPPTDPAPAPPPPTQAQHELEFHNVPAPAPAPEQDPLQLDELEHVGREHALLAHEERHVAAQGEGVQ